MPSLRLRAALLLLAAFAAPVLVSALVPARLAAQVYAVDSTGALHHLAVFDVESSDVLAGTYPVGATVEPLPDSLWHAVGRCAQAHGATPTHPIPKPRLLVLPDSDAFFVHDVKVDSLMGGTVTLSQAVVGWAFVDAGLIALVRRYAHDPRYTAHEALHFYAWFGLHHLGHPPALYHACAPAMLR